MFQLIILMINVMAYTKIPALAIFGILGSIIIAVPTILAFGEYYLFGVILVIMNTTFPILALSKAVRGK